MPSERRLQEVGSLVRDLKDPIVWGRVVRVSGLMMEVVLPALRIGDLIAVEDAGQGAPCEVVGFREDRALAVPLAPLHGVGPNSRLRKLSGGTHVNVGDGLIGRAIDAFGRAIDGGPAIRAADSVPIEAPAPAISERTELRKRFDTGVRVIDGLLTCGRGQRVGIFAGAGVGKSVLIQQIASQSKADVVVVGLIGERGREVRALLGTGKSNSMVVVAATSDCTPMERVRGAKTATAVAEYFCTKGANVLLIVDSLTRYAMALREIGLSVGEPPATKGYPPSVFAALPGLLERVAPMSHGGSITAFYTVLVEGDDLSDPVADSARSLLDGHIVLSRELAGMGHFPAVDVLASASRVASDVTGSEVQACALRARQVLSRRKSVAELQSLGAYTPGTNPANDEALLLGARFDEWSVQSPSDHSEFSSTQATLTQALVAPPKEQE